MRTPEVFVAYTPRGAGLRCIVAYLESGGDIYGWFAGPRDDGRFASRYFLIENFHTGGQPVYEAVDAEDVHLDWLLDEARRHELAAMQEALAREWLSFPQNAQFPALVRADRLHKFSMLQPTWLHYSPAFEPSVLRFLSKRWPLEYQGEAHERTVA